MTEKAAGQMLMLDEMLEQPKVLENSIKRWDSDVMDICAVLPENIQGVVFVGRGSSDNAATIGRYAVEAFTGFPQAWQLLVFPLSILYTLPMQIM